jgi:hypothetical protein
MAHLDANWVAPNLLIGSFPQAGPFVAEYAQVLVLCAKELQPPGAAYPGVKVVHAPFDDSGNPMKDREKWIAHAASRAVRTFIDAGKVCLVTCHMGLNRSGLVCALTLMQPWGVRRNVPVRSDAPACLTSDQAIAMVRKARGEYALGNAYFTRFLAQNEGVCGRRHKAFRMPSALG